MRRWNPSWNFLCGAPRTWHSAGRERGRSPSKGGWIWKGRTCFTRWWGQGHLSQSRTNTNCCSWFEPVQRSWAKLRCYWTSNDPDCFAALVNRPLHFISSETIVRKVESSVSHIRIPIEQHRYRFHEKKERSSFVIERLYRSIFWNLRRTRRSTTTLSRGEYSRRRQCSIEARSRGMPCLQVRLRIIIISSSSRRSSVILLIICIK